MHYTKAELDTAIEWANKQASMLPGFAGEPWSKIESMLRDLRNRGGGETDVTADKIEVALASTAFYALVDSLRYVIKVEPNRIHRSCKVSFGPRVSSKHPGYDGGCHYSNGDVSIFLIEGRWALCDREGNPL